MRFVRDVPDLLSESEEVQQTMPELGCYRHWAIIFMTYRERKSLSVQKRLEKIVNIRTEDVSENLLKCQFQIACDVKNPLVGVSGCSRIYGPQKGATEKETDKMDSAMEQFANRRRYCLMRTKTNTP